MHYERDCIYHVYNRSHEQVFFEKNHYFNFLRKVKLYIQPCCEILAWCLMPNHFHFLVQTTPQSIEDIQEAHRPGTQQLSKNWGTLLSSYTQAINKQYDKSGPLWAQRTKAKMLNGQKEDYVLICLQYIHQNPLRAGLVKCPEDWEYSSFNDFIGRKNGRLVNRELALETLGMSVQSFKKFVQRDINPTSLEKIF